MPPYLFYFFYNNGTSGSKVFLLYFFVLISNLQSDLNYFLCVYFYCYFKFSKSYFGLTHCSTSPKYMFLAVKNHGRTFFFYNFFWLKASFLSCIWWSTFQRLKSWPWLITKITIREWKGIILNFVLFQLYIKWI